MCGIAGVRRFGKEPISRHMIEALLLSLEHRGPHATGIAMIKGTDMTWWKIDDPAWKAVGSKAFKEYIETNLSAETDTVILHDRAATVGSPRILNNNHPLTQGVSAIVHNGGISNDDFLFREMKLERGAETDSDIIRAIIDEHGITKEAIRPLNRMSGSCASAIIDVRYPGKLMLLRSGSPLVYAVTDTNLLMWASEKRAIHHAQRQWEDKLGLWVMSNRANLKWATMPDNSAYIFGPKGLEWHDEFKSAYQYVAPRYRCYDTYFDRQKSWDKEAEKAKEKEQERLDNSKHPTDVVCVNCKKSATWPKSLWHIPAHELRCPYCKKDMANPPLTKIVTVPPVLLPN